MSFTPGTLIQTANGEIPVENLRPGDMVITRDNGAQELTFVRKAQMSGRTFLDAPHLRPVCIAADALGADMPTQDMLVTPNQRIVQAKNRGVAFFGKKTDPVAAKNLINHNEIFQIDCVGTQYIHLEFAGHQTIQANGIWIENFDLADTSLGAIGNSQRNEIREIFPSVLSVRPAKGANSTAPVSKKRVANLKFW